MVNALCAKVITSRLWYHVEETNLAAFADFKPQTFEPENRPEYQTREFTLLFKLGDTDFAVGPAYAKGIRGRAIDTTIHPGDRSI